MIAVQAGDAATILVDIQINKLFDNFFAKCLVTRVDAQHMYIQDTVHHQGKNITCI